MKLKKILQYAIGPIGGAVLGMVTMPFVAWFFSVEDVGRMTMLQLVFGLTISLFSLAMHQAYVREYHEVKDKSALFKTSLLPGLLFLLIITLVLFFIPISISEYLFDINSKLLTFLLLIGVFSTYFINFLTHVIRMQERAIAFSLSQIAPKFFLLFFIGFILVFNIKAEFKYLMLMNTLAVLVSLIIFSWLTRDTWVLAFKREIDKVLLINMLKFSLPLVLGGLAYWGLTTMDRLFLRTISGFEELGVYALSVTLAASVSVISTIFSNIWHPTVYRWSSEGVKPDKVQAVVESMLLLVAFIWSLAGFFSWVIPYFFPPEYEALEYLLIACISMPLLYMLSETTVVGIGITRKTSFSMLASIAAFLINALLNYLLIPKYGAAGAALATLGAFFIFLAVRTEASAWLWYSLPRRKIYTVVMLYIVTTSVMVLTKNKLEHFNLIWLGLIGFTVVLFYRRIIQLVKFFKQYLRES